LTCFQKYVIWKLKFYKNKTWIVFTNSIYKFKFTNFNINMHALMRVATQALFYKTFSNFYNLSHFFAAQTKAKKKKKIRWKYLTMLFWHQMICLSYGSSKYTADVCHYPLLSVFTLQSGFFPLWKMEIKDMLSSDKLVTFACNWRLYSLVFKISVGLSLIFITVMLFSRMCVRNKKKKWLMVCPEERYVNVI